MGHEPILTAAEMRAAEQAAFDTGIPEYALMERAGAAVADIVWRAGGRRDALILCGPGNNGGDGYVIARCLRDRGVPVRVAALGDPRTPSARQARDNWGGPVEALMEAGSATQVIDALFGTGLTRGLDAAVAGRLAMLAGQAAHSYAVDLPSGVATDSGAILSDVPHFDVTVALGAFKPAHLLHPAAGYMGRLVRADIGLAMPDRVHRLMPPRIAPPDAAAHKYTRGLVAIIGGAMAGASLLASGAAAHSGAGAVRRFADDMPLGGPHAIVNRQVKDATDLDDALTDERIAALLIGPGLGLHGQARERLDRALAAGHPLVLDADALTLLGEAGIDAIPPGSILTPHEGEFVRLFGHLAGSKIDRAGEAARSTRAIIVYKGADSVIAAPDGRVAVASGSSTWLSTAGTGDVLAGLAAGRLAVTGDPFRAACEAVWLHGEAARRAGPAFVADDLLVALPAAIGCRQP